MRQKKTLLVLALSLFVFLLMNAYADDFYFVEITSMRNVYDPSYFSIADQTNILTAVGTDSNSSRVFVQFSPIGWQYQISTYLPQWSALLSPWNIYVRNFSALPPSINFFETQNALFFIDTNNNNAYDIGEPTGSISSRPTGTYKFLDAPSNVKIAGGIYPTITWDPVAGAENYRIGIVGLTGGIPNVSDLQFITSSLTTTSYTYSGSPLQYGQSYAFFIDARDYGDGNPIISPETLVNEMRYFTEYTPVPEPATMILLGSGLIGLAVYGRRKFFKK